MLAVFVRARRLARGRRSASAGVTPRRARVAVYAAPTPLHACRGHAAARPRRYVRRTHPVHAGFAAQLVAARPCYAAVQWRARQHAHPC